MKLIQLYMLWENTWKPSYIQSSSRPMGYLTGVAERWAASDWTVSVVASASLASTSLQSSVSQSINQSILFLTWPKQKNSYFKPQGPRRGGTVKRQDRGMSDGISAFVIVVIVNVYVCS